MCVCGNLKYLKAEGFKYISEQHMTRRHMEMLGEGSRRSPELEEDFKRFTGVCKRGVQGLAPGQNLICVLWKQMMTLLQIGKSVRCYQSVPFASKPCWLYGEEMPIYLKRQGGNAGQVMHKLVKSSCVF